METLIAFQTNHLLESQKPSDFISSLSASTASSSSNSSSSTSLSSSLSPLSSLLEESTLNSSVHRSKSNKNPEVVDLSIFSKLSDDENSYKLSVKESVSWTKSLSNSLNYIRKRSIFKSDTAIVKIAEKNSSFSGMTNHEATNSSIQIGMSDKGTQKNNEIAIKSVNNKIFNFITSK